MTLNHVIIAVRLRNGSRAIAARQYRRWALVLTLAMVARAVAVWCGIASQVCVVRLV